MTDQVLERDPVESEQQRGAARNMKGRIIERPGGGDPDPLGTQAHALHDGRSAGVYGPRPDAGGCSGVDLPGDGAGGGGEVERQQRGLAKRRGVPIRQPEADPVASDRAIREREGAKILRGPARSREHPDVLVRGMAKMVGSAPFAAATGGGH